MKVKMKKVLARALVIFTGAAVFMTTGCMDAQENADGPNEDQPDGDYSGLAFYPLPDGTYGVAAGNAKYLESIVIPNEYCGKAVTQIIDMGFIGCTDLKSVTIPNSVTSIGNRAFDGCDGLMSITIPNSVTSIGRLAFYECYKLVEVINHSSLDITAGSYDHGYVAKYAKGVHTGESKIVNKDGYLFYTYDDVNYLLGYTGSDTVLVLPDNYNGEKYVINDDAFSYCTGLTSVTIPNSVTRIGKDAFRGCTGLTSVTIPNSVTFIGENAFRYCAGLTSITIPNSVTRIDAYAFEGCIGLKSVTIPGSVTRIDAYAFEGCTGLNSVNITDIAAWCEISFYSGSNPLYYAENLYLNGELVTDLVIPNSVTSIGYYAFGGCTGLTSITIPNSVTRIDDYAFEGCTGLTSITIPNSVTSIGDYAFGGCTGLTSITIPNSVTSIGEYALEGCIGLTSITYGGSLYRRRLTKAES